MLGLCSPVQVCSGRTVFSCAGVQWEDCVLLCRCLVGGMKESTWLVGSHLLMSPLFSGLMHMVVQVDGVFLPPLVPIMEDCILENG